MKKAIMIAGLLFSTCASAWAQGPGVNLSWDDCLASVGGGLNKNSTCLSNTEAAQDCFGSYVLPADLDSLYANEITIDITTDSPMLPCWWNFTSAPRGTGVGYVVLFSVPCASNAYDYWGETAGGSVFGSSVPSLMPDASVPRIRIRAFVAIEPVLAQPVAASIGEIYSFTFRLRHAASVGSCTGCSTPACIGLTKIRVVQAGDYPGYDLTAPSSRQFVMWQGGVPSCGLAVPTINKTWGSVKALYR
jgi:hypothetical protein